MPMLHHENNDDHGHADGHDHGLADDLSLHYDPGLTWQTNQLQKDLTSSMSDLTVDNEDSEK